MTTTPGSDPPLPAPELSGNARFGGWAALATGVVTSITLVMAVATPPRSGPLCEAGCHGYPYLDVAARFPRDYAWMLPAILAMLLQVGFMIGLEARARPARRLVARGAVALALMASITIVGDYFLQLAVVQPSLLAGEGDGISLLTQYNPHGLFVALEELGYLLLAASLAAMAPALPDATRLERVVRRLFVAGGLVALVALAFFVARYGHARSYLFEITIISIVWLTLIPGAFLMAVVFRRELRRTSRA